MRACVRRLLGRGLCSQACPPGAPAPPLCPLKPCPGAPPCRAPSQESGTVRVRVCCAPVPHHRPPCKEAPAACDVSCVEAQAARAAMAAAVAALPPEAPEPFDAPDVCASAEDRAAARHAAAKLLRRSAYLREVRDKRRNAKKPEAEYAPLSKQHSLCAADGKRLHLACEPPVPAPCVASQGSSRLQPPPPCLLQLENAPHCHAPKESDHCAHHSKEFWVIDRSAAAEAEKAEKEEKDAQQTKAAEAQESSASTSCVRTAAPACDSGRASRAGDASWCGAITPKAPPQGPCRPPSLLQRLRNRSPPNCCEPRRQIHSCGPSKDDKGNKGDKGAPKPEQWAKEAEALNAVLEARSRLSEVAKGRSGAEGARHTLLGRLELQLPKDQPTQRIAVEVVAVNGGGCGGHKGPPEAPPQSPPGPPGDRDKGSWLSVLQRRCGPPAPQPPPSLSAKGPVPVNPCAPKKPSTPTKSKASADPCAKGASSATVRNPCTLPAAGQPSKTASSPPCALPPSPTYPCPKPLCKEPASSDPCSKPPKRKHHTLAARGDSN